MSNFANLMRRADTLRRINRDDPLKLSWWTGYMRGLRRAYHGEQFGTDAEHELWLSAIESTNEISAALGRGYRAGLTMEARDPHEVSHPPE
jgi:hypothetical protein